MKTKFKSAISLWYLLGVILFNVIIIVLITSRFYLSNTIVSSYGIICLIVDIAFIIPMMIFTSYEFKDDDFIITEYPIKKHRIKYENIFSVEDSDFKAKNTKIVALSTNRLILGYTDENDKKKYISISPVDIDLFLIKLGGKLKDGEALAEKKAAELTEKMEEHNRKKKQWQKKKLQIESQSIPEIIEIKGNEKFDSVKIQNDDLIEAEEFDETDKN